MALQNLETLDEVIAALGGTDGLFDLMGAKPSTISMWKASNFPSNSYVLMIEAPRARGKTRPGFSWEDEGPSRVLAMILAAVLIWSLVIVLLVLMIPRRL